MFIRNGNAAGSVVYADLNKDPVVVEPLSASLALTSDEPEPEPVEDAVTVELIEPASNDDGEPDMDWHRDALDEYAAERGVDTTALPNKAAVLEAIRDTIE